MPANKVSLAAGPWDSWSGTDAGKAIKFIERYCVIPETREPMQLHPFQKDWIETWADPGTAISATVVGAGNAKTTTLAAFITAHLFMTDEGQVPIVADTVSQVWETTLGTAVRFAQLHDELEKRSNIHTGQGSTSGLYVPYRHGRAWAVADKPSRLFGLKPSIVVVEEMAAASMATYGALTNRLGKRPGSRLLGIGHPSFLEDNALLHLQRQAKAGELLPGVIVSEYVSDQRDHRDDSQWWKANPRLAFSQDLLEAIRRDVGLPEQLFRTTRLCQTPTGSQSCWLNALDEKGEELGDAHDVWMRGRSAHTFTDGKPTWVGVDVAKSYDHAAVVWGQFQDDGRLHVKARVWTPSATADIDLEDIADHLRWIAGKYDVQAIWYDPSYFYNAPALERELPNMVAVPPSDQRMSPLVGHAYSELRRTRVTHDDDETLTKHVMSAKRRYSASGFTVEKRNYMQKIDACVALILCLAAATGVTEEVTNDMFAIF